MDKEKLIKAKDIYTELNNLMNDPNLYMILSKILHNSDLDLSKIIALDSLMFMSHIANADGVITQRELNIINFIIGDYLSSDDLQTLMKNHDFSGYLQSAPSSIVVFCQIENLLYKNGSRLDSSLLNIVIYYFEILGEIIASADEQMTKEETKEIDKFIKIIKDYAKENTLSPFFDC